MDRVFTNGLGDLGSIPNVSYKRILKWYLIPPCLTLSIIRYVSRVKWSNPGKGVAPSPTSWCSSYWKGSLLVTLNYGHQLYLHTTKSWWKSCNPLYHTNHKVWRRLYYGVWETFANCKVRNWYQKKVKLNQTGCHSILQYHAIPFGIWLVAQGFVLMQNNNPKHTCKLYQKYIKSKEKQYVLQLMSWLA